MKFKASRLATAVFVILALTELAVRLSGAVDFPVYHLDDEIGYIPKPNQSVYLKRNPDVAASPRFFVWEYMSGGLSDLSTWHGDYVWPREHPLWATWYAFRRSVWPHLFHANASELPPAGAVNPVYRAEFEAALASLSRATGSKHPGILFLYPGKAEYLRARQGKEWLQERGELERIADVHGLAIVDISHQPEWNESLYRPDGTHPTAEGNVMLAKIVTAAIKQALH